MSGTGVKLLVREAVIGSGLALASGIVWKVAFAQPTTRAYKTYYKGLEKYESEHPAPVSPENAEILEKVEKTIAFLESQGAAEEE